MEDPTRFVGREGSPVLDRYPPKDPSRSVRGPPVPSTGPTAPRSAPGPQPPASPQTAPVVPPSTGAPTPSAAARPLLSLDRPFDLDEFSQLLGETQIRVEVPREALAEVLRRLCDFMGFGIYVYAVSVRPAPQELLKQFVVELQRVDFVPSTGQWSVFQERGRSDSPFGPGDSR